MDIENKSCSIGALGLSDSELKVLGSMAILTRARAEGSYVMSASAEIVNCDIVIVNAEDHASMIRWHAVMVTPQPPVMVLYASAPPADPAQHYLLRPFGPAKLLALLDRIAAGLRESGQIWKKPALSHAATAPINAASLRALVVDDSPTVCKQLELELRNFNIHADIAETGERGLELLAQHKYDLVFLDVVLPGTDGYQVCKSIRKNPQTKQTPVIMLTSKSSPFDRVRGSLVGCNAYLTKPVDYDTFRETVGKYVETET
ncbi:MAG: response regulator [Nitrosomonadales bacterium]|nr:response regulator [Nitrosomonadales bacterium]